MFLDVLQVGWTPSFPSSESELVAPCTIINYPNDSNISRANYYFLRPQVRELFEIFNCANLIEGANYY